MRRGKKGRKPMTREMKGGRLVIINENISRERKANFLGKMAEVG